MNAIAEVPAWVWIAFAAFFCVGVGLNWLKTRGNPVRRRRKSDWEGWRLYQRRKHWHEMRGRNMKSFGEDILSVRFDDLTETENRRLSELLREKDVEAAAALMEYAGIDEKEAIDRAERYTLREHPDAEAKGYPADYVEQDLPKRSGTRRVGFSEAPAPRRSYAEILAKIEQPPAPKPGPEEFEAQFAEMIRLRRRSDAMQLYMDHHGASLTRAKAAVDKLCPPSMWIWNSAKPARAKGSS